MSYSDTKKIINSYKKFGINLGLYRIKKILGLMGNPQNKLKFIHVAGTNGKGSVCEMISSILIESGYKTGLFISPHIIELRERIKISGEMISEKTLNKIINEINYKVDIMKENNEIITEFELLTVVALKWFADNNCDIVILEVGLGGRLDATNVINESIVSIIMAISIDHKLILGDSISKISFEKCGIIKQNGITISYPQKNKSAINMINKISDQKLNKLIVPDLSELKILEENIFKTIFRYKNVEYILPLIGEHQVRNALVCLETINVLKSNKYFISDKCLINGLKNVKHPARIEILSKNPLIILDGAHNPDGAKSFNSFLSKFIKSKNIIAIVSILKDKEIDKIFNEFKDGLFKKIITVNIDNDRNLDSNILLKLLKKYCNDVVSIPKIEDALDYALNINLREKNIVIFGSLYLACEIRPIVFKKLYKFDNVQSNINNKLGNI